MMTRTHTIGTLAAIGGLTATIALLTGLPAAKADELADLRANQELLQRRTVVQARPAHERKSFQSLRHDGDCGIQPYTERVGKVFPIDDTGIDIEKLYTLTFAIGAGLAALAGVILGMISLVVLTLAWYRGNQINTGHFPYADNSAVPYADRVSASSWWTFTSKLAAYAFHPLGQGANGVCS